MGFWQNLLSLLKWKKKRANVLVVGLDNSGKSTVVNYFKSGQGAKQSQRSSVPTIGFQVDEIQSSIFIVMLCILVNLILFIICIRWAVENHGV